MFSVFYSLLAPRGPCEWHIFIKITNDSNEGKTVTVEVGQGFAQGLFMPFGITEDDEVSAMRNGGFGSTTT